MSRVLQPLKAGTIRTDGGTRQKADELFVRELLPGIFHGLYEGLNLIGKVTGHLFLRCGQSIPDGTKSQSRAREKCMGQPT